VARRTNFRRSSCYACAASSSLSGSAPTSCSTCPCSRCFRRSCTATCCGTRAYHLSLCRATDGYPQHSTARESLRSVRSAALTEDRTIPAHGMRARNRGGVDATVVQLSADSGAPEAYSTY
jgi:hypothetical protein